MKYYFLSCIVIYLYFVITNTSSFKDVNSISVVRGIIGTLFWPITLGFLFYQSRKK